MVQHTWQLLRLTLLHTVAAAAMIACISAVNAIGRSVLPTDSWLARIIIYWDAFMTAAIVGLLVLQIVIALVRATYSFLAEPPAPSASPRIPSTSARELGQNLFVSLAGGFGLSVAFALILRARTTVDLGSKTLIYVAAFIIAIEVVLMVNRQYSLAKSFMLGLSTASSPQLRHS
ncbi:MAG TPA: hypothetical protein VI485_03460 [Vicinamibacterales bacterium]|nr:hypothetical protein [Vicinamibacterales bacterium]